LRSRASGGIVERDATKVVAQRCYEVTVEERPLWRTGQEQQHRSTAFVDVVHAGTVEIDEATLKRKQL
jgi:hypothetical protein